MKFLLIITIASILGGCASSKTNSQNVRETELADRSPASLVQNSIDSTDDLYQQVAPTIQPTNLKRWITEDVPDKLWGDYTSEQLSGLSISVKYKRGTVPAQVTVEAAEWNNSEDHTGARKDYLTLGGIRLKSGRTSFTVGTQSEIGLHICRLVYAHLGLKSPVQDVHMTGFSDIGFRHPASKNLRLDGTQLVAGNDMNFFAETVACNAVY